MNWDMFDSKIIHNLRQIPSLVNMLKIIKGQILPPILQIRPLKWTVFIDFAPKGPQKRPNISARQMFFKNANLRL